MNATLPNMKHSFVFPELQIGEIVDWYHGGNKGQRCRPAVVLAAYHNSLDLAIISAANITVRSGVRHCDDPDALDAEKLREGGFLVGRTALRMQELEAKVNELQEVLGAK